MKQLLPVLILFISFGLNAQISASSCVANSTITAKYARDAARLALRHSYHTGSAYTGSITIDPALKSRYLQALLAVYNCTLTARDTVIDTLNLHTGPSPELNGIAVNANSGNQWMQNLQNSVIPTGYAYVDTMIVRYHLNLLNYYQSTQYDVAVFYTDTNYNMTAMAAMFAMDNTVISSSPTVTYNDTKNITDSLNSAFTILNYSFGWGSCADGCDFRSYWGFKVYTSDCHVEYLGHTGDNLVAPGTGIHENTAFSNVRLFPNPVTNKLVVLFSSPQSMATELELVNVVGQPVLRKGALTTNSYELDLSGLSGGIYFVSLKNEWGSRVMKIVKE